MFKHVGSEAPDVVDAALLKAFFQGCQNLHKQVIVLAYHDCSDGGIFTSLVEMMIGGRCGVRVNLDVFSTREKPIATLFNEELGAVFQLRVQDMSAVRNVFADAGITMDLMHMQVMEFFNDWQVIYSETRAKLQGCGRRHLPESNRYETM